MFGKLSSKTCAALLFAVGLLIFLALAYYLGEKWSWEEVLVAVERSADAIPSHSMWQQNPQKKALISAGVFCLGVVVSFLTAELYHAVLEFFKSAAKENRPKELPGE